MNLQPVWQELEQWSANPSIDSPTNLLMRQKALDFVRYVEEIGRHHASSAEVDALLVRATALRQRLTTLNTRLFRSVRERLRTGKTDPAEWRALFDQYTEYRPGGQTPPLHVGYDGLDLLLNGVLGIESIPAPQRTPEPEMVHCEPSPARVALDLVDHVGLKGADLFCDIGAGLGHIALLVRLLSGARVRALEFDPGYCRQMRLCFDALHIGGIEVEEGDARTAEYAGTTVFYLFTPFKGQMLQSVMDRLRQHARTLPCTICTYGPISQWVQEEPWLRTLYPRRADSAYTLAIFSST